MGGRKSIQQLILHTCGHNEREREKKLITDKNQKADRIDVGGLCVLEKKFPRAQPKNLLAMGMFKKLVVGLLAHAFLISFFCEISLHIPI